jgi:tRNA (guanine37-N1)-methyltransferase
MALCLKVRKNLAQKALNALLQKNALCKSYKVEHDENFVYFPLKASAKILPKKIGGTLIRKAFRKAQKKPKSLRQALKSIIPKKGLASLLSSFDIIGDIAMLEIPSELSSYQLEIAKALMRLYPHLKTIAKKAQGTTGEYRIRPVEVIYGENKTSTLAKENGYLLYVDLNKAYYNPRMAAERMRIVSQIKKGENILVPFAGVGPYAIAAEKKAAANSKPSKIIAIELNPHAVALMRENIKINKCSKIEVVEGDAASIFPSFRGWADRIIMPHPTQSLSFLSSAFKASKDGAIIHLYLFSNSQSPLDGILEEINQIASKQGYSLSLCSWRVVQTYSPTIDQIVLDLKVKHLDA